MSIIAHLKLNQWQEHQLPDRCDGASQYLHVDDDFVISRTTQGVTVSTYGDDEWNMKMYDARGTCAYNFVSWAEGSTKPLVTVIAREMKKIQLARMYLFHGLRKPTSIRLIELRRLSRLALKNNLSLSDLFDDANINRVLLPSFAELAANQMKFMLQLLKELFDLRVKHPGFKFAPTDYAFIERIQELYDKHPKQNAIDSQQTKLIPSRLYAALIAALNAELDDFNANADSIVELFRQRKANPRFGLPECNACSYRDSVAWGGRYCTVRAELEV